MQIEGRNAVIELLKSNKKVLNIFLEKGINKKDSKIKTILKKAKKKNIKIKYIKNNKLNGISKTKNHQGVIAKSKIYYEKFLNVITQNKQNNKINKFIYIREANHQDNIGAIARTAEAAGFSGIIIPPKLDITAQAIRSSVGALSHVQIIKESVFNAIKYAQENLIKVIAIEVDTEKLYHKEDLSGDVMFIVGGENKSLSSQILQKCDKVVKIPMKGKVNSLNMSVAAAIIIYESIKQD